MYFHSFSNKDEEDQIRKKICLTFERSVLLVLAVDMYPVPLVLERARGTSNLTHYSRDLVVRATSAK
jgi:hypothetical protein